jgi:uncharacterized membrane protein YfcA
MDLCSLPDGARGAVVLRPPRHQAESADAPAAPLVSQAALVAVGAFAGFSSGFLGIGGGLAITVGLSAWLKVPQRVAQMISLALFVVPLTIPGAWVYWREGRIVSWAVLIGVVLGLVAGTDIGARLANRLNDKALRRSLLVFIVLMAGYMALR